MKVSELTCEQLDYWVAVAEGYGETINDGWPSFDAWASSNRWEPTANWSDAGPIIEREGIALSRSSLRWDAEAGDAVKVDPPTWVAMCKNSQGRGPAPLIAAMRAFIASKYGDTVPALAGTPADTAAD